MGRAEPRIEIDEARLARAAGVEFEAVIQDALRAALPDMRSTACSADF